MPDQAAILRQYCRYTGEIKTGRNIKQMVYRALQFATSDPKGPVYLMAAREVLEEVGSLIYVRVASSHAVSTSMTFISAMIYGVRLFLVRYLCLVIHLVMIQPTLLCLHIIEVEVIAKALMEAKRPLIITGYLGRNHRAPQLLAELCDKLPINVLETVGSDLCIRSNHEAYLGVTVGTHQAVRESDVILVLDCDVPWIPAAGMPANGKRNP